jgi:hypothetical protein
LTSCNEELLLSELSQYESTLNEKFGSTSEPPVSYGASSFGEALASHSSICSSSLRTNTDDTATEPAHYITYVVLSGYWMAQFDNKLNGASNWSLKCEGK